LQSRDLMAGAATGTGKTAAFALPMLERLLVAGKPRRGAPGKPRSLVLVPTRELAAQVHESFRTYGRGLGLTSTAIFGGMGMKPQIQALRGSLDVVVATPGRLLDHMQQRTVDLSGVEILTLDEADRMLDMGFMPAVRKIFGALPRNRHTLLFSATFMPEVKALAAQFMRDPAEIQIASMNTLTVAITHRVHPVSTDRKRDLVTHLLKTDPSQTLDLLPDKTRLRPALPPLVRRRIPSRSDSRQQDPERPNAFPAGFQKRQDTYSRCDGHRGARTRHPAVADGHQFRSASRSAGLHPPHRSNRPRRSHGSGRFARIARRSAATSGYPGTVGSQD
jgi:hypothetical protein